MVGRLPRRVFVGILVGTAVVLAAALGTALAGARRAAAASAERGLEQAADLVAQLLAGRGRRLAGGARVFVQGPYFRTLVAERRRDDILDQTFEAATQLEAAWVFITDANGVLVAKSDEPSASGDLLADIPLVSGALRGQSTTGFGGSGDSLVFLATAVPITAPGGTAFGVLVATTRVDSQVAADIAVASGSHVVVYLRDREGRVHLTTATLPLDSASRRQLRHALDTRGLGATGRDRRRRADPQTITLGDSTWFAYASTLNTAGGAEVGGYLVLRPATGVLSGPGWFGDAVVVGALAALLLAGLAALLTDRTVRRPLHHLARDVREVASGALTEPAHPGAAVAEVRDVAGALAALHAAGSDHTVLATALAAALAPPAWPEPPSAPDASRGRLRRRESALTLPAPASAEHGPLHLEAGDWLVHRYRIEARMGGGPSGVVYRAFDRARQDVVALKVIRPERVPADVGGRPGRLQPLPGRSIPPHRHLVAVREIGEALGTVFITSDYVAGLSLRAWFDRSPTLEGAWVAALARQLLRALDALHGGGLAHGDLKPTNVLLTAAGVVRVSDAGIGIRLGRHVGCDPVPERLGPAPSADETAVDPRILGRVMGGAVGAPEYLAPEQLIGAPPSAAGDLYALGVILHEARYGATPQAPESPMEGLMTRLRQTPGLGAPLASGPITTVAPPDLEALMASLIAPDPARRPASAAIALAALGRVGPAREA